jgi:gluconate 5-dehydrogenase
LSGKTALVTGGSRGLGLEIAMSLGQAGAAVAITARREPWLSEAAAELGRAGIQCEALMCDVADHAQIDRTVTAVVSRFGRIDILINNAAVTWGAPVETMPLDKWRHVLDTNTTSVFLTTQRVGAEMISRGEGGAIVNIASVAGLVGVPADILDAAAYSASKGAIITLTRDLAVKWAHHNIRINAIAPGFFETRLSAGVLAQNRERIEARTPMGRIGRPGEIGGVVLFLASSAASYVTGQVLAVDGGMSV